MWWGKGLMLQGPCSECLICFTYPGHQSVVNHFLDVLRWSFSQLFGLTIGDAFIFSLFNICKHLLKSSRKCIELFPFYPRSALESRGVQQCVGVTVSVCEPCRTQGTSMRMPSSKASVPKSWSSWSVNCRRWTLRYGVTVKPAKRSALISDIWATAD